MYKINIYLLTKFALLNPHAFNHDYYILHKSIQEQIIEFINQLYFFI